MNFSGHRKWNSEAPLDQGVNLYPERAVWYSWAAATYETGSEIDSPDWMVSHFKKINKIEPSFFIICLKADLHFLRSHCDHPAFTGGGRPQVPLHALYLARAGTRVGPLRFLIDSSLNLIRTTSFSPALNFSFSNMRHYKPTISKDPRLTFLFPQSNNIDRGWHNETFSKIKVIFDLRNFEGLVLNVVLYKPNLPNLMNK